MHCFSVRICAILFVLFGLTASSGCSTHPSGAARDAADSFKSFVAALQSCAQAPESCDKMEIYNSVDAGSKQAFIEAYVNLVRMDRIITTYFDPIEHKQMRERTGTDILDKQNIKNERDLFAYLFRPEALVFDAQTLSGLEFSGDVMHGDYQAEIQTHDSSQTFTMFQEDDGKWRLRLAPKVLGHALDPISKSYSEMSEYAQSYFSDELDRRKRVRDYFEEQLKAQNR